MVVSIRLAVGGAHRSQLYGWAQGEDFTLIRGENRDIENENHFHF
jgi:hypothetical protein